MSGEPFHISASGSTTAGRVAIIAARPLLSWLLRLRIYRSLYRLTQSRGDEPFACRALEALGIEVLVVDDDWARIPSNGALLVASNHPQGALDGLVLASILHRHRTDVRILTNHLLAQIPELADLCFFVDPFGGPVANARSRAGLRAAHLWLRNGGVLVVFPSGEVAHRSGPLGSRIDSPWRPTVGRLALTTGAKVLPAFIGGRNSRVFYAAGRVHPAFRTALLARELLKKRGQVVTVRLGTTLLARDLSSVGGDAVAATRLIRQHVDRLSECCNVPRPGEQTLSRLRPSVRTGTGGTTTSEVGQIDLIRSEIAHLPPESCLIQSGGFQVFLADAMQIPHTLPEIGRLREVTYRAIGEGTGRHVDLDGYDARYLHLFSWDREQNRVIGAYRIGPTDRIMATHGVNGFYTRTLFQYDERLIARLSPALELGRSFIRSEYQKNFNALLLLWKGIGQFVVRHPQYRVLFGPVSISSRYSDSSHRLLMAFLHQNHLDRDLAALVEALNPHPMLPAAPRAVPRSIDEANKLIADAESDGKGVPVLLRQYLKLNARLLGFNVDPNFGDALDALMTVDLTAVDPVILSRYLGRREAARFLAYHRPPRAADAA